MILELLLRHFIDPNPRETALAMARVQLARQALLDVAQIVRDAGLKGLSRPESPAAPELPPGTPAPTWTREQPSMRLRIREGVLQQMWVIVEMQGNTPGAKRDEWRDVPMESGEPDQQRSA